MSMSYEWLFSRTRAGAARDPRRARALLDRLGVPDAAFRSIRVVGTNGKGSTCAMLEAGLIAAGARTGRFTSPHLVRFEERVRVQGHEVPPERTRTFVTWARDHAPDEPFFELTLALAARYFHEQDVEWAVMEAGVGGQSDATQALRNVALVLLTNVALDHVATLGPTLADIARDKASAAQPGVPFLTTARGEALDVVRDVTADRGAPLYTPDTHPSLFDLPRPPRLAGLHQAENARLALAALRLLGMEREWEAALNATHPGRLERFDLQGREFWLDGAHNPHAAAALARALPHVHTLVFGALGRKAAHETLALLRPLASQAIYTTPGDGAADPEALARAFGGEVEPDPREALRRAVESTPPGERILVTGSLYLVGALRTVLDNPRVTP